MATSRARSRCRQDTGALTWAADCHGDTYSSAESNGAVYVVGHSHYCGNVGGGFPQPTDMDLPAGAGASRRTRQGTNLHEPYGYPKDWYGQAEPVDRPLAATLMPGTFTGQEQAAWSVDRQ